MKFSNYLVEEQEPEVIQEFTKEDIIEMLEELDQEETQVLGEAIMDIIYDESFELDDLDFEADLDEKCKDSAKDEELSEGPKKMKRTKNQMNRDKKKNKSAKRKLARKRKKLYKKNKAKIKRYNKKAARKRKSGKTVGGKRITTHR